MPSEFRSYDQPGKFIRKHRKIIKYSKNVAKNEEKVLFIIIFALTPFHQWHFPTPGYFGGIYPIRAVAKFK